MFYSTFYFPMPFWSQRKVLTIPYKASTPFKSLGIMRKSVSDKKKLLQFLVGKRQLSVVIRWAPALVSPINNLLSLSRVSFCREGSLFGTDLEKLPINWLRPHTHTEWEGHLHKSLPFLALKGSISQVADCLFCWFGRFLKPQLRRYLSKIDLRPLWGS